MYALGHGFIVVSLRSNRPDRSRPRECGLSEHYILAHFVFLWS
jgi:hypothetical protein